MIEYLKRLSPDLLKNILNNEYQIDYLVKLNLDPTIAKKLHDINYVIETTIPYLQKAIIKNNKYLAVILTVFFDSEIKAFSSFIFNRAIDKKTLVKHILEMDLTDNKISMKLEGFFNFHIEKDVEILETKNTFSKQDVNFFELLNYQFIAKEQILSVIEQNNLLSRMLLHMPTGTGKTKTTTHAVIHDYQFNKKGKGIILWLAHTHELLKQAYFSFDNVWSVLGKFNLNVSFNEVEINQDSHSVCFLSYQKLISIFKTKPEYFHFLRRNVVIVVADEAHKCLATETRKTIEQLMRMFPNDNNKYLLGLSATPGRKLFVLDDDSENQALSVMFEKRIISIQPQKTEMLKINNILNDESGLAMIEENDRAVIKYFQKNNILAKIVREEIDYSTSINHEYGLEKMQNSSTDFNYKVLDKVSKMSERNAAIIKRLYKLGKEKIPTILFACSVQHGKYLESVMNLLGVKSHGIYGEMDKNLRNSLINGFNEGEYNILINFEVLTTGFDSPRIRCVFITRPTNSIVLYSQMLGRGLRGPKMGGNCECLLIDLKDNMLKFNDENRAFKYFEEYWR